MSGKRISHRASRAREIEGLEEELIPTKAATPKTGQVSTRLKPKLDAAWRDYLERKGVENGAAALRWLVYYAVTNDIEPPEWVRSGSEG